MLDITFKYDAFLRMVLRGPGVYHSLFRAHSLVLCLLSGAADVYIIYNMQFQL